MLAVASSKLMPDPNGFLISSHSPGYHHSKMQMAKSTTAVRNCKAGPLSLASPAEERRSLRRWAGPAVVNRNQFTPTDERLDLSLSIRGRPCMS